MRTQRSKDFSIRSLQSLTPEDLRKAISRISDADALKILYDWKFWARPNQLQPEGSWGAWLCLAGRGWGKTRVGAEWVKERVETGECKRIALVAATAADARDTMVEGESGILNVFPPERRPKYEPSKRRITFHNGAMATCFSAEEPDRLRGPQHDGAWCDEVVAWKYPDDAWSNLRFGLRLGKNPRIVATTTPKPIKLIRELIASDDVVVTRGSTFENYENLADVFIKSIVKDYEGTRLGRQELHAEILDDVEGALWRRDWIERSRLASIRSRDLQRIVIAIDPAVTSGESSDETGIVVAAKGVDGRGYILDDLTCRMSADGWARRAVQAYHHFKADRIIGEANNGGDLIERVIRLVDADVPYRKVHASKGKLARAEPIAALYEQGRISHVGTFAMLEDEYCNYTGEAGEKSPNRLDAAVWAMSELFVENQTVKPKVRWL